MLNYSTTPTDDSGSITPTGGTEAAEANPPNPRRRPPPIGAVVGG